jgi:hypothetical protein
MYTLRHDLLGRWLFTISGFPGLTIQTFVQQTFLLIFSFLSNSLFLFKHHELQQQGTYQYILWRHPKEEMRFHGR